MVYDDDTGPPVYLDIRGGDEPVDKNQSVRLPSKKIQKQIIELAEEYEGDEPRIQADLNLQGINVSIPAIKKVLAKAKLNNKTDYSA